MRETRQVTLQEGRQPAAVLLGQHADRPDVGGAPLPHAAPTSSNVLDTTFPHDKPQMLYWNVQSEMDGEATVEITYFTSGITWSADYVCIADPDETQMDIDGLRPRVQQLGRGVRERPGAAGGGHDQPGREDRRAGADAGTARSRRAGREDEAELRQEATRRAWSSRRLPIGAGRRRRGHDATEAQADHQGGPERVLHLHDRRHGDHPQRLDASGCGRFEGRQVPFKIQYRYRPAGVRRPAGAHVPARRTTRSRSWAPRRCPTAWSASSATTAATA